AGMPKVTRDTTRIEKLASREHLFRTRRVLGEVQRRVVWPHDAEHRIAVRAAADRSGTQASSGVQIVQSVQVRTLEHDPNFTTDRTRSKARHDLNELIVVNLEEDRCDAAGTIGRRERLRQAEYSLIVPP